MSSNQPPPYPGDSGDFTQPGQQDPGQPPSDGSVPPGGGWGPPPAGGGYGTPPPGAGSYEPTGAISWGWRAFKDQPGAFIALALVLFVGNVVIFGVGELASPPSMRSFGGTASTSFQLDELLIGLLIQIVITAVGYIFTAALVRGSLDVVDGRRLEIGAAFRLPFARVMLTGLLLGVLTSIGFVLCILPGLVFYVFAYFTLFYVLDEQQSPIKALGSSFRLVASNFGPGFLTGLLCILILFAGLLACGVGLLVAVPITYLAGAYAYRRFNGRPVATQY